MKKVFLKSTLLLCALMVGCVNVWGATGDPNWSYTVVNGDGSKLNTTKTTFTVDESHVFNYSSSVVAAGSPTVSIGSASSTYGIKLGASGSNYFNPVIFKTDAFKDYAVTKVRLYLKHNGSKSGSLTIKQGSITVGTASVSSTSSWITVTSSETNEGEGGTLEIKYEVAQALYINKIEVWYEEMGTKHDLSSAVNPVSTGTVSLGATSIAEGKNTTISASPESGYYFVNWTVTGEGSSVTDATSASTTFTMGTENATVTANFAAINYWAVTYDYNDGVTDEEEVRVLKAEAASYTLKAAPSRYAFNFTGWKIGETTYAAGAAYAPAADVTVQAQWEFDDDYLTTYNKSNKSDIATGAKYIMVGSNTADKITTWKFATAMGSDTYLHASVVGAYGTLNDEKAELFDETPEIITLNETADGWTLTTENGKIGIDGDKKIYYDRGDMTWDLDGTDEVPTFSATFNESAYTMQFNWNSGTSRFTAYTSSQKVAYFYRLDDGKDVYTLTLNFNDGVTDNGTHRVLEGASYTLTAPTRSGYVFLGWNTALDGSGTFYPVGDYSMPAANTTLYAVWAIAITPAYEKTTFVTSNAMDFSDVSGLKAYRVAAAVAGVVTIEEVGEVPASTPLLLIGTAGTTYNVPVIASADPIGTNMLLAGDGTTEFDGTTYDYLLYSDGLFYKIGEGSIATDKAYLHCATDPTSGEIHAPGLRIVVAENNATNIEAVYANEKAVKFFEKGQIYILRDGVVYDAIGRKIR